jgi:hypothetical protein
MLVKLSDTNQAGLAVDSSSPLKSDGNEMGSGIHSSRKTRKAVSKGDGNVACLRSSKGEPPVEIDILRSPQALTQTIEDKDQLNGTVIKDGKKNNKANYVHNLSKKVSKSISTTTTAGSSSSVITKGKGKGKSLDSKNKNLMNTVGNILSPSSKIGKNTADEEVEEESSDPDDYNRTMSEDEDGDF